MCNNSLDNRLLVSNSVATMYIDTSRINGKKRTYVRHLLRSSYRENGKVRHHTIANISHCSEEEVQALKLALRHKSNLTDLGTLTNDVSIEQGASFGALDTVYQIAKRVGIISALGNDRQGKLAFWQIFARMLEQGSRLSSVRLARDHSVGEVLGLTGFDEDDLYENLDWCHENQAAIEEKLFAQKKNTGDFFLYDVTSSYFEGTHNELAAFGYNRDGKRGKMQMVGGLLCASDGDPISIELFKGNTSDQKTVDSQVEKLQARFGVKTVTLVGDRGMLKSKQIKLLSGLDIPIHYITAITKAQIRGLLRKGTLQLDLFDDNVAEVQVGAEVRYILKRNPVRAEEMEASRESKKQSLSMRVEIANKYLAEHPRANPQRAQQKLENWASRLKISNWISVHLAERTLTLVISDEELVKDRMLDGCYCIKTDLPQVQASKEVVHARYKDLALVEQAFRTSKTTHLEIRPIFLIKEERTRGHALITMLAYKLVREFQRLWQDIDITVLEALHQLATICLVNLQVNQTIACYQLPTPRPFLSQLLQAAQVTLPKSVLPTPATVSTKKKLPPERKTK